MSLSNPLPPTAATRSLAQVWPEVAIVTLALLLRLVLLGLKPPHFDEGVNGFFVDQMTREGPYHYDPTNFHGPLHFYFLFVMQTLFGRAHLGAAPADGALLARSAWRWRWAIAAISARTTCRLAALGIAISPAMTFYGRYAIHESFLLLFAHGHGVGAHRALARWRRAPRSGRRRSASRG